MALAVQNILGDLFASLSINLDKPFVIGDFVVVDDLSGTVEHVGLKTTRIRSLSGEQLVFSNADLLKSRIRNYKRMHERRIVFAIGVTYDTPADTLAAIPVMLQEAVEAQDKVRFDRAHFKAFGAFSLDFEVVCTSCRTRTTASTWSAAGHQPGHRAALPRPRHRVRLPHPDAACGGVGAVGGGEGADGGVSDLPIHPLLAGSR